MDNSARKKLTIKMVFGIAIPLLIMVVTLVMVGASFAWFSDAKEVTISTISLSTAQAYRIDFALDGNELFDNMKYAGQTAIAKDGGIISAAKCVNNPGNESNRAFSFVNVILLDTAGRDVDFTLNFDDAKITKQEGDVTMSKRDYAGESDKIPYAFTWFFKEYITSTDKVTNFTGSEADKTQKYAPISPQNDEVFYTPYGALKFGADGLVSQVNGKTTYTTTEGKTKSVDEFSVLDAQQKIVAFNADRKLYDFYIVFAPEQLFWSQYFKGDLDLVDGVYTDRYTLSSLYDADILKSITGDWENQMFYSGMDYLGATFRFSAMIDVLKLDEKEGA